METYLVMEYCDRGSLADAISNRRFHTPAPESRPDVLAMLRCLLDIATGVSATRFYTPRILQLFLLDFKVFVSP